MVNKIPTLDLWPEPSPFQNRTSRLQKDHNWKTLGLYGPKFSKWAYSFEERVSNLINGVEQPNEIVDAHLSGSTGMKFKTITDRMNYMEDNAATKEDMQLSTSYATLRRLGQKYRTQGSVASNAQGFASLGNQICVQYFQNHEGLDPEYGTLLKFDITDGTEIAENEIHAYHGNSMTYNSDNNKLYLCSASSTNQNFKQKIFEINTDTLEVEDQINLADVTELITVHSIGWDDIDKMFVVTDNKTLEFYDIDWNKLYTLRWENFVDFTPNYMQGVQCNGDTLYWIGGQKSQIWVFKIDKANKNLIFKTIYTFDDFQENLYPTGEIEGLGFDNENSKIYLCSHITVADWGGLTQYFVTEPNFKTVGKSSPIVSHQTSNAKEIQLYVGHNANYNPDGTQDNPFASLLEATVCIRTPYIPFPSLNFLDDFEQETLVVANLSGAMISTKSHKVKACVMINVNNVYVTNLVLTSYSRWNHNALYIYNSKLRINGVKVADLTTSPLVKDDVDIVRSEVFINVNINRQNIRLVNSVVTSTAYTVGAVKNDNVSKFYGKNQMGTGVITNVNQVQKLSMNDFLWYQQINVRVDTKLNGKQVQFYMTPGIIRNNVDLIGFAQVANVIYMCAFHFVKGDADRSTIEFFQFPSLSEIKPASYSIHATVSD